MSSVSRGPRLVLHGFPEADPSGMSERARQVQDTGWDGLVLADSPNLTPDVFVALAVAARATDRLELGTAVANPLTRPPAVLASAVATLQQVSDGRAVLGLGRGDSALLQVGLLPSGPQPSSVTPPACVATCTVRPSTNTAIPHTWPG